MQNGLRDHFNPLQHSVNPFFYGIFFYPPLFYQTCSQLRQSSGQLLWTESLYFQMRWVGFFGPPTHSYASWPDCERSCVLNVLLATAFCMQFQSLFIFKTSPPAPTCCPLENYPALLKKQFLLLINSNVEILTTKLLKVPRSKKMQATLQFQLSKTFSSQPMLLVIPAE